jgi:hypothetical protein
MELPVSLQAAQFALAAALGAGLAALYGFLRACSRLHPRLTGLTDAAFSLAAFYSLVCFTLGPARGAVPPVPPSGARAGGSAVVFDRVRPRRTAVFGVLARGRRACPAGFAAGGRFF